VALEDAAWRQAPGWIAEQRAHGAPLELVDATAARTLAPGLAPTCAGGVYCAIDGQAEAMATVSAFAAAAGRIGARIEEGVGATALVAERSRVVAVECSDGRRRACDVALVAAGTWSAPLLAGLGLRVPLATRALQMLLTEPASGALAPVVSAFGRKLSLKQLASGAWLIGGGWPADIPDEAQNRWALRDDSVKASLAVAREVYPAVGEATLARGWAGLEAFTPDDVPVMGPVPGVDGLIVAAGFCGHGFALAPTVGDVLARLALGRDPLPDLWRGLRIERFDVAAAIRTGRGA